MFHSSWDNSIPGQKLFCLTLTKHSNCCKNVNLKPEWMLICIHKIILQIFVPGRNLKSEKKSSRDKISSHLKHMNTLRALAKDRDELMLVRNSSQNEYMLVKARFVVFYMVEDYVRLKSWNYFIINTLERPFHGFKLSPKPWNFSSDPAMVGLWGYTIFKQLLHKSIAKFRQACNMSQNELKKRYYLLEYMLYIFSEK